MRELMNKLGLVSAADLITGVVNDVAQRFDDAIPANPFDRDDDALPLTGIHHIVRHYEHLLAWIVDEPEQVTLDCYDAEELRDLIFYAARTGRVEALDLLIERAGFDVAAYDGNGLSLLDHAQRDRQYAVVHYLINRGAGCAEQLASPPLREV